MYRNVLNRKLLNSPDFNEGKFQNLYCDRAGEKQRRKKEGMKRGEGGRGGEKREQGERERESERDRKEAKCISKLSFQTKWWGPRYF